MTSAREFPAGRRVMNLYLATGLTLVGVLLLAGLALRMAQAGWLGLDPADFYALLTLHGVGMITALVLCGMGSLWYLMRREVEMSVTLAYWAYGLILAGVHPVQAVLVQAVVMFLILGSVASTTVVVALGLVRLVFTRDHRLLPLARR